ncbi:hypothetical protein BCR36DRAFT_582007 [Piromyces finnis]|uniref:Clathrin/coatomer adaptor adaptin-like N-terminal domain-containing protein n=1 Tax=Piromyces finnis TaxID=1754191 RepID=A0A1Y1VDN7_9FUNG|nr:hypothetical protein BCR36DRAFT_582007 [Piromyces finnis]|eukprot:ORX53726.1 hypothetical protein BCR36DRAFT_582007 [Piromyces finnis]
MNIGNVSGSNSNVQKIGNVAFSIAKEAAKFSKKVSEEIVEKSREYSQSNQLYDKYYVDIDEMKNLLDSKYEAEKIDGLKRAIGFIAKGRDCSALFPSVVKNVAVTSLEVKRLVYDYLLHYANKEQELALLAINTIQKELSDKNPEVRALAIRVMSSIKIPAIMTIVLQGIKKTIKDDSILVRQAAVNSLIKCYQMEPEKKTVYVELITVALKETSPYVIGNVINAFNNICPERLDLIHIHYRRLCVLLIDVDCWGQLAILDLLLRYAKCQFKCPYNEKKEKQVIENNTTEDKLTSFLMKNEDDFFDNEENVDKDLRLLLDYCKPILQSYNIAIILKIVTIFYYLAPRNEFNNVALTLLRFITKSYELQYPVLQTILSISNNMPEIFRPHIKFFFINNESPYYIKELQMKIIINLTDSHNSNLVYNEFHSYIRNEDPKFVILTMEAISILAKKIPILTEIFLKLLLSRIMTKNDQVSAECIIVIRKLLQLYPEDNSNIIKYLIKILPSITIPKAKANLLWLIGHYCQSVILIVPNILRIFSKNFNKEEIQVKYQILNLGAKLVSVDPTPQNLLLFEYVLNLSKYDIHYDLRDKARFYRALILNPIRKYIPNAHNKTPEPLNEETTADKEDINNSNSNNESFDHENEAKDEIENDKENPGKEQDTINEKNKNRVTLLNSESLDELLLSIQKILFSNNMLLQNQSNNTTEDDNEKYTLGSLSHCVNSTVKGYVPLPEWPETTLNENARDNNYNTDYDEKSFSSSDRRFKNFTEIRKTSSTSNNIISKASTTNKRYITLDEFYNSTDDDSEEESEEEDETEEESEEEESEEEESEEEESEEEESEEEESEEEESEEEESEEEESEEEESEEEESDEED